MKFIAFLRLSLFSVVFSLLSAAPAFAGMTGGVVTAFQLSPNKSSIYYLHGMFGHGVVADDGITFTQPYFFSVHITDTQIVIDGFSAQFEQQRFTDAEFNGIKLAFDSERKIPNFTINAATAWDEFTADRLEVVSNQLFLNFQNLDVTKSTSLVLDLTDTYPPFDPGFPGPVASPVPEPGSYAMLLAGLAMTGFAARRRKSS